MRNGDLAGKIDLLKRRIDVGVYIERPTPDAFNQI
jgi:hypothetical protein